MLESMISFLLKPYQDQEFLIRKKAQYLLYFLIIVFILSFIGIIFHGSMQDLRFYLTSLVSFSFVLAILIQGNLNRAVTLTIIVISANILSDIMRFEFTSYEKVVETLMEAFLSYSVVGLFALRRQHILYTIASNSLLFIIHALLIYFLTYHIPGVPFPYEGYKYYIGGLIGVFLVGFVAWANMKVNNQMLQKIQEQNEMLVMSHHELEELVAERTQKLENANKKLEETNQQLLKISMYDSLTGVYNRGKIMELGAKALEKSKNDKRCLSIVMMDIDHFKMINDTYGHYAGDLGIQFIANLCKNDLRPTDHLGRFGGEEFLIIMENTSLTEAYNVLTRLREKIEQTRFKVPGGHHLKLTISAGVCEWTNPSQQLDELIHIADKALYLSKSRGRNQVTIA